MGVPDPSGIWPSGTWPSGTRALGCLVLLASIAPQGEGKLRPPGERTRVAGLRSVVATSRLVFRSLPDVPHTLRVTYAFPGRVRSLMSSAGGRTIAYRFGDHAWILGPGDESQGLEGARRRAALLELELRRAVLLWPEGFTWKDVEGGLRADLGPLGHLLALVDGEKGDGEGEGRPREVRAMDREGELRESLTDLTWRRHGDRTWPHRMVMRTDGEPLWDEELLTVDTGWRYVDDWFMPPDRRQSHSREGARRMRSFDLRPLVTRRVPLEEGLSLGAALKRTEALMERDRGTLAPEGLDLDPAPHLELDPYGRPVAAILVLQGPGLDPPEGWTRTPGRAALGLFLGAPGDLGQGDLRALREAAGGDLEAAGAPFLRVQPPDHDPRRAEVVLPLGG